MRYKQAWDGEWVAPIHTGFRFRCCDCKLVHVIDFRVRNGQIQLRPKVDKQATRRSRDRLQAKRVGVGR